MGGYWRSPPFSFGTSFEHTYPDEVKECTRRKQNCPSSYTWWADGDAATTLNFEFWTLNSKLKWGSCGKSGCWEEMPSLTAKGNLKRPPLPTVVTWVKKVWEDIPEAMIKKSFLKCCISNKMDSSKDDILWQDEESDRETDEEDEDEERHHWLGWRPCTIYSWRVDRTVWGVSWRGRFWRLLIQCT